MVGPVHSTRYGTFHTERAFIDLRQNPILPLSHSHRTFPRAPSITLDALTMLRVDVSATRCPEEFHWRGYELSLHEFLASGRFATIRAVRVPNHAY